MPSDEAEAAKERGNAALAAKDFSEAVKCYTEAIRADGNCHTYFSNRSAAFASMNKPVDALADAEKCIQLEPTFARGYGRKGLALYKLGRYADSMTAYGAGLKKDSDNKSLKDGLDAATKAKQVMDANMAGYGRSTPTAPAQQGYGGQPATMVWRTQTPGGVFRLALNLAVVVFSVLYVVSAINPLENDPARYTYFGRAVMAALGAYISDIASKWSPCPVSPMDVYRDGIQSETGQKFAMWTQGLLMTGPSAPSFMGCMFAGAFLNSTPVPPALGCLLLVALHDIVIDLSGVLEARLPSVAGKLSGLLGSAKSGLRLHGPTWCAYFEAATMALLVLQLLTPKRAILQVFLTYQGLTMKYNAAVRSPTKDVWHAIDGAVASKLPGPVLGVYRKATGLMASFGSK